MSLQEQVSKDLVVAMKNKEKEKLEALRFLKSLFIQNNTSTKPTDDLSVVVQYIKKLQESVTQFPPGSEIIEKTKAEIAFLSVYLPTQFSQAEVEKIISEIKAKFAQPTMGDIMKELTPQIKGKFDGKIASDLVKASLVANK